MGLGSLDAETGSIAVLTHRDTSGNQTHGRGVIQVPEQPSHRLPEEFGGNEWLVDELYEQYQKDKNTVDTKWWPLFESFDSGSGSSSNGSTA
ncbi:MAG: hypothetical protein ABIP92_04550, partial [Arthrobacter sp.]